MAPALLPQFTTTESAEVEVTAAWLGSWDADAGDRCSRAPCGGVVRLLVWVEAEAAAAEGADGAADVEASAPLFPTVAASAAAGGRLQPCDGTRAANALLRQLIHLGAAEARLRRLCRISSRQSAPRALRLQPQRGV